MVAEHGMTRFLISRVLSLAFVMWLVTVIAFVVIRLAPGDPSATMLGADATPQAVAEFRANYELDGPIPVQYFAWLGHVVRGDLGTSIYLGRPCRPENSWRCHPSRSTKLRSSAMCCKSWRRIYPCRPHMTWRACG